MDIEIVIKGGVEISKFYPKKYAAFEEALLKLVLDEFPGVSGCHLASELTPRHKKEEAARERLKQEKFNQTLIEVLADPEVQELFRVKTAEPSTKEVAHV